MLIKSQRNGFCHPISSEITSHSVYQQRRALLKLMASGVAGAAVTSWATREALAQGLPGIGRTQSTAHLHPDGLTAIPASSQAERSKGDMICLTLQTAALLRAPNGTYANNRL